MKRDDIITLLTTLLGPLKIMPQDNHSHFEKFGDVLKQSLTQASLEFRRTGVQFPDFQLGMLPEDITEELEKMTDEIITAQTNRKTNDPVFWLRQRNVSLTTGIEESVENFLEPEFSFGPFINPQSKTTWFDFFLVPKQLRFKVFEDGLSDFMIITLPPGQPLPSVGTYTTLDFADCTIWISVKTIAPGVDNKYVGIRAKNCAIKFPGIATVQAPGFLINFSPGFLMSFQPVDSFANGVVGNASPKAIYPDQIEISFKVKKWTLQSFTKSVISLNGDPIGLGEGAKINPVFLEQEMLIHLPLPAEKDSWEILQNNTERFRLAGKAVITDTGWFLPVTSTVNAVGIGGLGMTTSSGYLGFRGTDGLALDWPGLENGKLNISKFLLLARPGRMNLKYTYTAPPRSKQQLTTWQTRSDTSDRSMARLKPLPSGTGNCIADNQQLEALVQPVKIGARVDRPLNSNQQRFDITDRQGLLVFLQIEANTTVFVIGNRIPAIAGMPKKRRIPQSLCLRNALLTTDNPISIFIEGTLVNNVIPKGFFHLIFPVYRLINTLPDPYISNQDEIFDGNFERFNELWRNGEDTLPDQFLFTVTSVVQWNDEATNLQFTINKAPLFNRPNNSEVLDKLRGSTPPCSPFDDRGFHNEEIEKLRVLDFENVIGAFGFLQGLPGDRSLVDVSGSANFWGVSFSSRVFDASKHLAESVGFPASFPFRIKGMDLVSSGRMSRLFTLPHIQWEPVMKVENPQAEEDIIPSIINFADNGSPTRIASSMKNEVVLAPRNLYDFIITGFNNPEKPRGMAAHFTLPFGICAFAYFNPTITAGLPSAKASFNEPVFSGKKTGNLIGGMQLHLEAVSPPEVAPNDKDNHQTYFIGSVTQFSTGKNNQINILGDIISGQFKNEFTIGGTVKVPLERIDFSGYGASIFSKWLHESANYGQVSQVTFEVMLGRTAHEVVQIKSILFPWGVPVVRSIVIQRKNTGIVTRYDSGWVAVGPGEFNFLSHAKLNPRDSEFNPYNFHPGLVKGIYDVREIRDMPPAMDITRKNDLNQTIRFSGVYFNGDVEIENITKGAVSKTDEIYSRVHSIGQFGYVMLADPGLVTKTTTLANLFPPKFFKDLLNDSKIGGSLGGPLNAAMNIAVTGQRAQLTRVAISPNNEANISFVVSVWGTIELPKEGSWTVVKCLSSKDIVPLNTAEAVPIIRNGLLSFNRVGTVVTRSVNFRQSNHCIGDPAEIDKYAPGLAIPKTQYSFLQTTGTQKLLFRRPSFVIGKPTIVTDIPDLADAFRLLNCNTIFPNLSKTLSLPDGVKELVITGDGKGLQFDEALFSGPGSLHDFVPRQLLQPDPGAKEYELIKAAGFQVLISYNSKENAASSFQVDLSSEALDDAAAGARKKWQTVNKDVAIVVNLGSLQPLLTLRGQFRSEAGKDPEFENPECELGGALQTVKDILQVLALLTGKGEEVADSLKVVMGNSPDSWNYKMSIEQRIPVIQFPDTAQITLATPPPLIMEASLLLGVFFNLSLSPDPKNLIKPGAGAVFGFEGMIQIQLITIGIAAAYGVGITKVKAYVDLTDPKPQFEFTFGFGATVIVSLPVVGLVSVTRSFSLTGNIDSGTFLAVAGQMLRGVLSLAGGLLIVAIQIEGKAGVKRKNVADANDQSTIALFEMIFSLDVSLAFVISYDFTKSYTEEITLS